MVCSEILQLPVSITGPHRCGPLQSHQRFDDELQVGASDDLRPRTILTLVLDFLLIGDQNLGHISGDASAELKCLHQG